MSLDRELSVAQRINQINVNLKTGSHYVIIEAREAGKDISIYDTEGNIIGDELDALAQNGIEHLIFEAPLKSQQVALILKYGSQVNLGNIAKDEVTSLATLRQ